MIDEKIPARFNLDNFNFRISYSTERTLQHSSIEVEKLIKEWSSKSKFNRLINRYTLVNTEFPLKVDFSIVRESSSTNNISESKLFKMIPKYEIEIEIDNNLEGYNLESLNKLIMKISKYILSGLQNTNFPVGYNELTNIGEEYLKLINVRHNDIVPSDFIGP